MAKKKSNKANKKKASQTTTATVKPIVKKNVATVAPKTETTNSATPSWMTWDFMLFL